MTNRKMKWTITTCVVVFALLTAILCGISSTNAAANATDLPFALTAPKFLALTKKNIGDSPTTLGFAYAVTNEMNAFFVGYADAVRKESEGEEGALAEYLQAKGVTYADQMWMLIQIDWALDDVNDEVSGWHYNEYWEQAGVGGLGTDEDGFYHNSWWDVVDVGFDPTKTVNSAWLYRGMNESGWTGTENTVGVRDQMREEQYSYEYNPDTDDFRLVIDWTEHTMYSRARFVVVLRSGDEDSFRFSPWSTTVSYGKDAPTEDEALAEGDVPAPVITGLRAIPLEEENFNDNPLVAFTLTVPDSVAEQNTLLAARNDTLRVEVEARVKGTTEWKDLHVAGDVTTGELKAALAYLAEPGKVISAGTEIELRARYLCLQQEEDDLYSGYSKIIGFGSDDITVNESPAVDTTGTPDADEADGHKCKICHKCSEPLGLCIWIWIVIIVVVVLVIAAVVFFLLKKKKGNKGQKKESAETDKENE